MLLHIATEAAEAVETVHQGRQACVVEVACMIMKVLNDDIDNILISIMINR